MGTARSAPGIFTLSKKGGSMKKGKDRSAKAFFSVEENAREMVKLAFSELGLNIARPSGSNPTEMAVLASKGILNTLGPVPPSMTTRIIGKEVDLGSICNF